MYIYIFIKKPIFISLLIFVQCLAKCESTRYISCYLFLCIMANNVL